MVSRDGQNRVNVTVGLADDGDEEGGRRPALVEQALALEKRVVLAVAAGRGEAPDFGTPVHLFVGRGSYAGVDRLVDVGEFLPARPVQANMDARLAVHRALRRMSHAKFVVPDRLAGLAADGHVHRSRASGCRCNG